ncbi:Bacterial Ig-like domain (group 2) [compost metagenome]
MTFGFGFRLICLVGAWGIVSACSDMAVQHVAEPSVLQISPDHITLYMPGEQGDEEHYPSSSQVTARILDEAGTPMLGAAGEVRWETSDPQVVKVEVTGRLTALATGSATIRATAIARTSLGATMSVLVRDVGRADVVVK